MLREVFGFCIRGVAGLGQSAGLELEFGIEGCYVKCSVSASEALRVWASMYVFSGGPVCVQQGPVCMCSAGGPQCNGGASGSLHPAWHREQHGGNLVRGVCARARRSRRCVHDGSAQSALLDHEADAVLRKGRGEALRCDVLEGLLKGGWMRVG